MIVFEILQMVLSFGSVMLAAGGFWLVVMGLICGSCDREYFGYRHGWEDGSVWAIAKPFYEVGYYLGGVSERRKARRKSRRNHK